MRKQPASPEQNEFDFYKILAKDIIEIINNFIRNKINIKIR